jgi:hypothetical protein
VVFEDKNLKPASVKLENLRIVFDLSMEQRLKCDFYSVFLMRGNTGIDSISIPIKGSSLSTHGRLIL